VVDLGLHHGWDRGPELLDAARSVFSYGPGENRATGYLYCAGEQAWPAPFAKLGPNLLGQLWGALDIDFNIVAFQAYRDGAGCGWHTDSPFDVQAILSLGVRRTFGIRQPGAEPVWMSVAHGTLVTMPSGFQAEWEHCIPEEDAPGERISLVFRTVAKG